MKKVLFLFVLILTTYNTYSQELPPNLTKWTNDGTTLRKYYLIDGDEFTRTYVDYKKWSNSYDWGRAICKDNNSYEIQYYTDGNNIDVNTFGKLKLLTKDDGIFASALSWLDPSDLLCDGSPNERYFPYTSGMLFSKRKFRYGLFEINVKLPGVPMGGQGLWPAFWLYEFNNSTGGGDEIDIFEAKQECPYYIHTDLHPYGSFQASWNSSNVGGWKLLSGPTTGSYNTYRAVWEPGGFIQFSLNNSIIENTWPINYITRMTLIANVAVGRLTNQVSAGCPTVGFEHAPNNTTAFPSSMDIEYIRIWKPLYCAQNVVLCNYPTGLIDDESISGNTVQIGNSNCVNNIVTYYNGMQLDIVAISEINFVGETTIDGAMYARIVNCPNPPQNRLNENNQNGYIDNEDNYVEGGLELSEVNFENVLSDDKNKNYKVLPNPSLDVFSIELTNDFMELISGDSGPS